MALNWDAENETDQIKVDPYAGETFVSSSGFFSRVSSWFQAFLRWYMWKTVFWTVFIFLIAFFAGSNTDIMSLADRMSNHAASDGYIPAYNEFRKNTEFKSTKLNAHPLYNSEFIKKWEKKTGLVFDGIYRFMMIKNSNGDMEELLVMKKPAFDYRKEEKEALSLELSTTIGDDAENICDLYLGKVPTKYQKSFYDSKKQVLIRSIDDELTHENDDGAKKFRCVIDQEKIRDLLDE